MISIQIDKPHLQWLVSHKYLIVTRFREKLTIIKVVTVIYDEFGYSEVKELMGYPFSPS
jgi:hypothetical protein